ncbi:hypothetical protein F383_03547 [Gossypium arboreum]|uniref:Uncharacterized protein n=1 Tax=Gossypium arboreum TaxID=29729 RepID=A0A0B0MWR8_GOSAR|nr:hypothetical protein F383_27750 [Gossypium arboreum]KHG11744.1 hypothetical protein F383_11663 [Gossypium arboreum]KHG14538.1 hypothetical protein F383_03547 [Gossypium arboreum]
MRHWVPIYFGLTDETLGVKFITSNLSDEALDAKLVCWLDLYIRPSSSRVNRGN